jgi:hypothetical protein
MHVLQMHVIQTLAHVYDAARDGCTHTQVMDEILGKDGRLLPWEGARLDMATRRKLGIFKNILLDLLHRDPAKRKSMAEFCQACHRVLSGTTTVSPSDTSS